MIEIGQLASEIFKFEKVDIDRRRWTTTTDHWYTISSPCEPSAEVNTEILLICHSVNFLTLTEQRGALTLSTKRLTVYICRSYILSNEINQRTYGPLSSSECCGYAELEQDWKCMIIYCVSFHPCRIIRKQIWLSSKRSRSTRVINCINLEVPESRCGILSFKVISLLVPMKDFFEFFFPHMGLDAIFVMWPGTFEQIFQHPMAGGGPPGFNCLFYFDLLSSGVVRNTRDLQVSVATRFCRVLIFVSS